MASTPVPGFTTLTGYIYDAEGTRVAKGIITAWSCNPSANGFSSSVNETDYVLDQSGAQMVELATDYNGAMAWQHTNIWAGGKLLGTYNPSDANNATGAHLYFDDPLGSRRVQTDADGVVEQSCNSLPFGDGETCSPYPTENLFTGKERDTESGNDYFDARYYSSTLGRFMSPDWSAKEEPVPYANLGDPQSLNLYAYVYNNPLIRTDPNGHTCDGGGVCSQIMQDAHAVINNPYVQGGARCPTPDRPKDCGCPILSRFLRKGGRRQTSMGYSRIDFSHHAQGPYALSESRRLSLRHVQLLSKESAAVQEWGLCCL